MANLAVANPGANSAAVSGGPPVAMALIPFSRAAKPHAEPFFDTTFTLGASAVNVGPVDIISYGYARHLLVEVDVATTGNSATVVAAADSPWNLFSELAVQDVNGAPMYGPVNGYAAYLIHRFGAYVGQEDPATYPATVFTAMTVGSGATAPTGRFTFRIPIEINGRDALGALANMNASATYKFRATLNNLTAIFSTPPNGVTTARVRITLEAWSQPDPVDLAGRPQATVPPANGTTQYWSWNTPPVNAGAQTVRHQRVGNYIRNCIYVARTAAGARSDTLLTNPFQVFVDSRLLFNYTVPQLRALQWEAYGDPSGNTVAGVVVVPNLNNEFFGGAGFELRDRWLPTTQATRLELQTNFGVAGTLEILTNDVAPRGDVFL